MHNIAATAAHVRTVLQELWPVVLIGIPVAAPPDTMSVTGEQQRGGHRATTGSGDCHARVTADLARTTRAA
jgi:hypothetical protein